MNEEVFPHFQVLFDFFILYALKPFRRFDRLTFRLYLYVDKKGHIVEMKFSLSSSDWSCSV